MVSAHVTRKEEACLLMMDRSVRGVVCRIYYLCYKNIHYVLADRTSTFLMYIVLRRCFERSREVHSGHRPFVIHQFATGFGNPVPG